MSQLQIQNFEQINDNDDDIIDQNEIAKLNDLERERIEILKSKFSNPSDKDVKELMKKDLPTGVSFTSEVDKLASRASKYFLIDLINTARQLSGNNLSLTPDLISLAFYLMEEKGKIPGKGNGVKRSHLR